MASWKADNLQRGDKDSLFRIIMNPALAVTSFLISFCDPGYVKGADKSAAAHDSAPRTNIFKEKPQENINI